MPSPPPSARLRLEPRLLDARTGSRSSPRPSLPSWLLPTGTGSFAWSPDSDPSSPSSLLLPDLHPAQQEMTETARRFNVAACGRQMGKTTLGVDRITRAATAGVPCAWFAPSYKYLDEVWRSLRTVLEPMVATKSEQQHRLDLRGGGVVEAWSLDDPDAGRGRRYGLIVIDEAAIVRDLETVWQASLRPTLSVLGGGAWFLSTPKGLNYFSTLYQLGQDPLEAEWMSWQMPSSASPFITAQEIEAARRSLPERVFEQEYLAHFLQLAGAGVFRNVRVVARLQPARPEPGHVYVFGVDWGRTEDFTAISVFDATLQEQVLIDRFNRIDYEFQTERLQRLAAAYRPRQILAEANAMGMPIIERLQRGYALLDGTRRPALPVTPFVTTNATKAALVIDLSVVIEDGALTLIDDQVQTGELLAFESQVLPSGLLRYGAPEGAHDDTVVALALAYAAGKLEPAIQRSSYGFSSRR